MKYLYEDLSDGQFEVLTVLICRELLGQGVQAFSTGPDGGRDGRFEGTAALLPSSNEPWKGKVIIQAKHTLSFNRTFSDPEFFSEDSESAIVQKEMPRIDHLRREGELDHYLLFSNRRMSAGAEERIRTAIAAQCGIPGSSVLLVGVESIELYLRKFPGIDRDLPLTPWNSPLIIQPEDLADVVEAAAATWDAAAAFAPPVERVSYEEKNAANALDADFAKEWRSRYLKNSAQIQQFLADPVNQEILVRYEDAASEIQRKMLAYWDEEQSFARVMLSIEDQLLKRDPILTRNKRLTRSLLFYMYWSCDIGKNPDV